MKIRTVVSCVLRPALALAVVLPLAACGDSQQSGSDTDTAGAASTAVQQVPQQTAPSLIASEIHRAMQQARQELSTQDIDLGHIVGDGRHDRSEDQDKLPKAVVTPQGDLVIAGKTVRATPEQHAMLLDYRQQIVGIAEAGMDIGEQGANLGTKAAKEAIWAALTGKNDKEIEQRIKPQTEQIKAAALKLCQRLPDTLVAQQKLAAAMPEFRPYATMTQKDVDDCGKDLQDDD